MGSNNLVLGAAPHMAAALESKRPRTNGFASIAEFDLTQQEEEVLKKWALNTATARAAFNTPAEFGLLFLAATAIAARTRATPHCLWPNVHEVFGRAGEVFDAGYPVYAVRRALLAAVHRYGLRHVLTRNLTTQHWYVTVLLQIAWTHDTIKRLPEWLSGASLPLSLELLLRDPSLRCDSFSETFDELRRFRRGSRADIHPSAWLCGELRSLGAEYARRQPELGTAAEIDDDPIRPLVHLARGGVPEFKLSLCVTDDIADRVPARLRYVIQGTGRAECRAIRQENGSYSFTEGNVTVGIASGSVRCRPDWSVRGEVLDETGSVLWSDDLQLADPGREVELFTPTADECFRRVADAWEAEVSPDRPALIAVAGDIELVGVGLSPRIEVNGLRWHAIAKDQLSTVRATLDGDLLWEPLLRTPANSRERERAHRVTDEWAPGQSITWSYPTPPGSMVVRAVLAGRDLAVEPQARASLLRLERASTLPCRFIARLTLVRAGNREAHTIDLPPPRVRSLLVRSASGLVPPTELNHATFSTPVSFLWGEENEALPYLFEGNRPIGPIPRHPRVVRDVVGLGAALRVLDGRYNSHLRATLYEHKGLINTGMITRAEQSGQGAVLELTREVEWAPDDFHVECLLRSGEIVNAATRIAGAGCTIVASCLDEPVACVVHFGTKVVGAYAWSNAGAAVVKALRGSERIERTITWFLTCGLPAERSDIHRALLGAFVTDPERALLAVINLLRNSESEQRAAISLDLLRGAEPQILAFLRKGAGLESAVVDLMNKVRPAGDAHLLQHLFRSIAVGDPITAGFALLIGVRALGKRAPPRPAPSSASRDISEELGRRLGVDAGFLRHHLGLIVRWVMDMQAPTGTIGSEIQRLLHLADFRSEAADAVERAVLARHGTC